MIFLSKLACCRERMPVVIVITKKNGLNQHKITSARRQGYLSFADLNGQILILEMITSQQLAYWEIESVLDGG